MKFQIIKARMASLQLTCTSNPPHHHYSYGQKSAGEVMVMFDCLECNWFIFEFNMLKE